LNCKSYRKVEQKTQILNKQTKNKYLT